MLEASDLRHTHHRRLPPVLRGVDLSVRRGEVVGLAGSSGTGKTTLGRILAGYLEPDAGTVLVDGEPLPRRGTQPVQLVFQHPELAVDPRWRLREALTETGRPDPSLLSDLGITPALLDRFPHEVSGGELQRVAVARALQTDAPFLIADEMSAMLDAITQAQLWHAVLDRVASGRLGVVAISHDEELLSVVADRLVRLDEGRLTEEYDPATNAQSVPGADRVIEDSPLR